MPDGGAIVHIRWSGGRPYLYKSVRIGKTIKHKYIRSYAEHLRREGTYLPATKGMTATQITMMRTIGDNVHVYKELRRQNQKPAFKPYSTHYYRKWKREFGL